MLRAAHTEKGCMLWAWHAELTPQMCHRHTATGVLVNDRPGCCAGVMNRTLTAALHSRSTQTRPPLPLSLAATSTSRDLKPS